MLAVTRWRGVTFAKSRMRESRPYGSVRAKPNGLATRLDSVEYLQDVHLVRENHAFHERECHTQFNLPCRNHAAVVGRAALKWPTMGGGQGVFSVSM